MELLGEDAVKRVAHGVFLLINPEGGVKAWGWSATKKQKHQREAAQLPLMTPYVLRVAFCGTHLC